MSANYTRQSAWVDGSGGGTPVSAGRLNAIENGIEAMDTALVALIATKAASSDARFTDTRTPTDNTVSTVKIVDGAVTSAKIADGTIVDGDISGSAAIAQSKISGLAASLAAKSDAARTINAQTGTAYTLALSDADKVVEIANAAANTITVPPNSTVAFPVGTQIDVVQTGAGVTTIAPGAGVTVNYYSPTTAGTRTLKAQWAAATLIKRAADTWVLIGNLT